MTLPSKPLRRWIAVVALGLAVCALILLSSKSIEYELVNSEDGFQHLHAPFQKSTGPNHRNAPKPPAFVWEEQSFSKEALALSEALASGRAVTLKVGELSEQQYRFRPVRVTTDDFWFSDGSNNPIPMDHLVFQGRSVSASTGPLQRVSAAVVADMAVFAISQNGRDFLVEFDPATGEAEARELGILSPSSPTLRNGDHDGHNCSHECTIHAHGIASIEAPTPDLGDRSLEVLTASVELEDLRSESEEASGDVAEASVDHTYFRLTPAYDASLVDMTMIWVSDPSQTGSAENLPLTAASYLSYAARSADSYERQLGFRLILQELMLIPEGQEVYAPVETSGGRSDNESQLEDFRTWLIAERSPVSYSWGHAALWTLVNGDDFGVIGTAYVGRYGYNIRSDSLSVSIQEERFAWDVFNHELGHNVGSLHTSGGLMNPSLLSGNEDFYTQIEDGSNQSAAGMIYDYMSSDLVAGFYQYGPATLRNPYEMPFAVDDFETADSGATLRFDPTVNDALSVFLGATNLVSLFEVGPVYPREAGQARLEGNEVVFTPDPSFSGAAWFSYTIQGDQGNNGNGWLHAADVIVEVGGSVTSPSLEPPIDLAEDYYVTDFSEDFRFNPLLNDFGSGYLAPGDIDVVLSPDAIIAEDTSGGAFFLVDARIIEGSGAIWGDSRAVFDAGAPSFGFNGYITYRPSLSETGPVVIEYTVQDGYGAQATSTATLAMGEAPVFTEQPESLTLRPGDSADFTAIATGYLSPSYQWYLDGNPVLDDENISGSGTSSLSIASIGDSNIGTYVCVAANTLGEVDSSAAELSFDFDAYEAYLYASNLPLDGTADGAPEVDLDGDSLGTVLEFAVNGDVRVLNFDLLPILSVVDGDDPYLEVSWIQRSGGTGIVGSGYTAEGVSYTLELTDNLEAPNWQSGSAIFEEVPNTRVDRGDGTESRTARSVSPANGIQFVRLKVELLADE